MQNKVVKDQFFDFLLNLLDDNEEKEILKLIKRYKTSSESQTRELLRESLKYKERINND